MTPPSKPIGEVLPGVEIQPLPDGWVPLEIASMVKCLDDEGDVNWISRYTVQQHYIEALGAMQAAVLMLEQQVRDGYAPDEDD